MPGTHNSEFMGIAATGKHFTVPGATIARVSGEKMAEAWLYWDRLGMVEQLGSTLAPQQCGTPKALIGIRFGVVFPKQRNGSPEKFESWADKTAKSCQTALV